ncbi:hypothetical protein SCNU_18757 [Gordonia neofelifaecis NRRL B-59395]|uniref:Uncharacterized protein n=1 Tax=Gordonia neofelifaecis NRRL B-59395 TaxID=644548 RepID=F1YPA2_9ACTN|nr:hypothetical protein SCNU_18757 [Gordonia neofelifaecis NRRL B-59395]
MVAVRFDSIRFEEHDLRAELGDPYFAHARNVPRFIPRLPRPPRRTTFQR